ncbi:MAG: hypothetical protein KAH20_16645 [Methylococcales bacterium]|nr:hypothetical protein [Methylococcales bacterium]
MFKKIYHTLFCLLAFYYASSANAVIPIAERNALIALYNSTEGANWTNNNGWVGAVGTECQWHGVSCLNDNQVSTLSLEKNNLKGNIPRELGQLSKLTSLSLGTNQLSGSIPKTLMDLSLLKTLDLKKNQLSGIIPKEIGQLSLLNSLFLSGNKIQGTIPNELFLLNRLNTLNLRGNQLSGAIPKELKRLVHLTNLSLDYNKFSGTIPRELGQLSRLEWLYLAQNKLTGIIPKELAKLRHLKRLYLNNNQLSGSIPNEFGTLQLRYLYLDGNRLSGIIPKKFGSMNSLEFLKLDRNLLTGTIPKGLTSIKKLSIFNNCLSFLDRDEAIDIMKNLDIGNQDMCEKFPKQKHIPVVFTYPNSFHTNLRIDVPLVFVNEKFSKVSLNPIKNPLDEHGFYWKLNSLQIVKNATIEQANKAGVTYNPQTSELKFKQIAFKNKLIKATFRVYNDPDGMKGTYFQYIP